MFFEWYFGFFIPFSGIEWYFKLPLRVLLSPAEISLNGPMVLNDTERYSTVISGIPLALFCKGTLKVQIDVGGGDKYNVSVRLDMSYYV